MAGRMAMSGCFGWELIVALQQNFASHSEGVSTTDS